MIRDHMDRADCLSKPQAKLNSYLRKELYKGRQFSHKASNKLDKLNIWKVTLRNQKLTLVD